MAPTPAAPSCPECEAGPVAPPVLDRRLFLRAVGTSAVALAAGRLTPAARARAEAARQAEAMVRELVAGLSADQRKKLVLPWDHKQANGTPTRLGMYNAPVGDSVIHKEYTKPQAELLAKLFRSLCNGDDGYRRLSRGGDFDDSGAFDNIGCLVFGDPKGDKYSLVFAGHHLTLRCDGDSEDGAAFGGPLYYGHSPNGYSDKNVFAYQTKSVRTLFDALDAKQRKAAVLTGSPGEQAASVQFRKPSEATPGLPIGDMTADQKELVEKVMRDLVSPYRKEDGDEVMEVIKANGGMGKISLAYYQDPKPTDNQPWHFWRLEGPGFVWNFRVLPHVHTYVNVSTRPG
ncbi:MAG: DUF3500 domain-containing protein [Gemmataceae bacterium]|nr:DUF3500 domain-containing protein [Gemmataceae bacterium]